MTAQQTGITKYGSRLLTRWESHGKTGLMRLRETVAYAWPRAGALSRPEPAN